MSKKNKAAAVATGAIAYGIVRAVQDSMDE